MEQQAPRARYDEFAEQFTSVLHENWSDILAVINANLPQANPGPHCDVPQVSDEYRCPVFFGHHDVFDVGDPIDEAQPANVVALRAAGFRAAVDAVAAARDQVVLDQLVGLDAEVLEQADRIGLVMAVEHCVVADHQRGGGPVGGGAVEVVAAGQAQVVDVVALDDGVTSFNVDTIFSAEDIVVQKCSRTANSI